MEFNEEKLQDLDMQYMLGDSILSAPVVIANCKRHSFYLPNDEVWYDFFSFEKIPQNGFITRNDITIDTLPLFIRGGRIIATKERMRRSSEAMKADPFTVLVALDRKFESKGFIYSDDGICLNCTENLQVNIHFSKYELWTQVLQSSSLGSKIERIKIFPIHKKIESIIHGQRSLEFTEKHGVITIRKPELDFKEDWKIKLVLA